MGNCCKKIFFCFKSKRREFDYLPLSSEGHELYLSQCTSMDMNVENVGMLKIKPSNFIREKNICVYDYYDRLENLGEGSYGNVFKVKTKLSNEIRAMKMISKSSIIYGVKESDILNEIKILKSLDHLNIIKIFEFFKDENFYYIICEYCPEGDLIYKLDQQKDKLFDEKTGCYIMKQIFSAVSYLHSKKIFHGDLKLENILVDSTIYKYDMNRKNLFDIKLIDFGCSKIFSKEFDMTDIIGSANYLAPEVLDNNYDELCDIWSCGVIMYVLLSGIMPFSGETEEEILSKVRKGEFFLEQKEFLKVSLEAKDLISKLLTFDPKQRPSARSALRHPWFKVNSEEIRLSDIPNVKEALENLISFGADRKFQQAVITFITHNLIRSEEVNNLKKIFETLDRDHDGRITKNDIKNSFLEVFGRKLETHEIDYMMKAIDHDNSGYIEFEEFIRATINRDLILDEENLKSGFDFFDIDKNGFISPEEINKTIGGEKSIPDNLIVELLAEIGKDLEQDIAYDEYKKIMRKALVIDNIHLKNGKVSE